MKKPTVDEISEYCSQRGNGIDSEAFWDFYQSKGWVVGKAPMKDWRAAVRTWERKQRTDKRNNGWWFAALGWTDFLQNRKRRSR